MRLPSRMGFSERTRDFTVSVPLAIARSVEGLNGLTVLFAPGVCLVSNCPPIFRTINPTRGAAPGSPWRVHWGPHIKREARSPLVTRPPDGDVAMSSTIGGGDDGGEVVPFPKSAEERRALRKAKES